MHELVNIFYCSIFLKDKILCLLPWSTKLRRLSNQKSMKYRVWDFRVIDPWRKRRRAIWIAAHRYTQQPVRNAVQTFKPSGVYVRTALSRSTASASVGLGQGRKLHSPCVQGRREITLQRTWRVRRCCAGGHKCSRRLAPRPPPPRDNFINRCPWSHFPRDLAHTTWSCAWTFNFHIIYKCRGCSA